MYLLQLNMAADTFYILLLFIILLWSIALVTIANSRFYDNTTKLCWFFIILVLNIIGIGLFVFWGRKEIDYGNKKSAKRSI
ncbi:MAG: PLDc N-terminal domain-containing protein [Chitinophagaceae bacterium]|nr:PLDc N-terminal domain-containing protein [Chitinophagaceae bacterium]MBK8953759.1 PLDc N-terminal domain-containing protein [Chitinophagaceae bacterium]